MSEKQSQNEVKGIDPKNYGSFDKFMDKAKRVSRYVLPGVAVALTASCTPEMINALAKTVETPDVSPLPSDFTKTPAPLSTEANYELTPTVVNPATQELTLVSPTEIAPSDFININMDNVIYPPMKSVKENFEKGEYDASVETIKQWVSVWDKMNLFENNDDINEKSFVLVPLDGTEKVTCVALESDKYANTLYCPPIDNNVGGLKIIPNSGQEQETDKPIIVKLTGTKGLRTIGEGSELTYQIADKYTYKAALYYDIKTKGFVEGSYIPLSMEAKENEPIRGNVVCFSKEYCLGGQMDVDPEIGKIFYEKYMDALIHHDANKDYFNKLLKGDISYQTFQKYLNENDGLVPPGLKLLKKRTAAYVDMTYITKDPINLSALKTIVVGPKEWHENYYYIADYLSSIDKSGILTPYANIANWAYFGWFLDKNNYLVLLNGALDSYDLNINDGGEGAVLGGVDGSYVPERDNIVATVHAISFIVYEENYDPKNGWDFIRPFTSSSSKQAQVSDIYRILGRNLFKAN